MITGGFQRLAVNTCGCCPPITVVEQEQEGIYWKRLWQQYAFATGSYVCGAITHIVRHKYQGNVRDILNLTAYSLKVLAIPFFIFAALNAKKIDRGRAEKFIRRVKANSAVFVIIEGMMAAFRETDPKKHFLPAQIVASLCVTACLVSTLIELHGAWIDRSRELA